MGFGILGFRVWGLGFGVWVWGLGFRVWGLGLGFGVLGLFPLACLRTPGPCAQIPPSVCLTLGPKATISQAREMRHGP